MRLTYRCESCGLGCRVVSGALGLGGEFIHCPRCGKRAKPGEEWTDTLEIVEVSLGDDGRTTHELRALEDDTLRIDGPTHKASPETQSEALAQFEDEAPSSSTPHPAVEDSEAGVLRTQQNPARSVLELWGRDLTPPGTPSVVFSSQTRRVDVSAADLEDMRDTDPHTPSMEVEADEEIDLSRTSPMPQLRFTGEYEGRTTRKVVDEPRREQSVSTTAKRFKASQGGVGSVASTDKHFPTPDRAVGDAAGSDASSGTDKSFPAPGALVDQVVGDTAPLPRRGRAGATASAPAGERPESARSSARRQPELNAPDEATRPAGSKADRVGRLGQTASELAVLAFGPTAPQRPQPKKPAPKPSESSPDAVWHTKGLEGKAWSSKVVKRALSESGVEPSGELPIVPDGTPTETMTPLPDAPRLQVDLPDLATPKPQVPIEDLDPTPKSSEPLSPGDRVVTPAKRRRRPPSGAESAAYSSPRSVARIGPRRKSRVSRALAIITLFVAVACAGVILGSLWSKREQMRAEATGFAVTEWTDATLVRAAERAERFGLRPIQPMAPLLAGYQIVRLDYPARLQLQLRLTNQSDRQITLLSTAVAWYLVHDSTIVVSSDVDRFEPAVTIAEPLEPGESVIASTSLIAADSPLGTALESFVWIEVTATGASLEILFSGSVTMFDLPTSAPTPPR